MPELKETLKKVFSKNNLPYFAIGGVIIGAYLFLKRRGPAGIERPGVSQPVLGPGGIPLPPPGLPSAMIGPPSSVGKKELVRAKSYQLITHRTPGMKYALVSKKNKTTGEITFRSPVAGIFTRNVVQEGKKLWAEIQPMVIQTPATIAGLEF